MISISKLLCDYKSPQDHLRYNLNQNLNLSEYELNLNKKPIVVWNVTNKCNLKCLHCYSKASYLENNNDNLKNNNELSYDDAIKMIDDLAIFKVPVLLFSGGEPLLRNDIFELSKYASKLGIRTVLSTNGTLITENVASKIKESGFSYVGISLDGLSEINDKFRNKKDSFLNTLNGIKNCIKYNLRVGLRFTINSINYKEIPNIFNLAIEHKITRLCFYHLVYTGRAENLKNVMLPLNVTREIINQIFKLTKNTFLNNYPIEVLTVDNHCDGAYLYLTLLKEDEQKANNAYKLLEINGGNGSGISIACIDEFGNVHADQFWRDYSFGNIKKIPFSKIWTDTSNELMFKLKDRKKYLKGRCKICKFLKICNGNFRIRAKAIFNDIWAPDPSCYLSNSEIGLDSKKEQELLNLNENFQFEWFNS